MRNLTAHLLTFFLLVTVVFNAQSKTTYIPTYYTIISVQHDNSIREDSTIMRELSMESVDKRYMITVTHDSVTREKVKAIKRLKFLKGMAATSAILHATSAMLQPLRNINDVIQFEHSLSHMSNSFVMTDIIGKKVTEEEQVSITIFIENNTDREMVINDMQRGLTWFMMPNSYIELSIGNFEMNKFRIAYADNAEQNKDYVSIEAANYLTKKEISYEDDEIIVFPIYSRNIEYTIVAYGIQNKYTYEKTVMSVDDYKPFLKNRTEKQGK